LNVGPAVRQATTFALVSTTTAPRLLVTGGRGRLAGAVVPAFERAGWDVVALGRDELDITDRARVLGTVDQVRPAAVVNLAACTDIHECERDPAQAEAVNARGVRNLADACARTTAHLCHLSSDYVFDGAKGAPYVEGDAVSPLSVYGSTKAAGEQEAGPDATVVRTAWVSGHRGPNATLTLLDQAAVPGRRLRFVDDQRGSPTVSEELAETLVLLVAERLPGCFHVTNGGEATWYRLARHVLAAAGHDPSRVEAISTVELEGAADLLRPRYSVLDNEALRRAGLPPLRPWEDAFAALVEELVACRSS
jgi:dTDP-4-dehydrorhamnose reductase